ncbi:hypothetical protein ACOSQ2_030987 [Xanthoceras sorbifolium]
MSIFSSSGKLSFSLKVGLVSTCVLSAAIVLKLSMPLISEFVASDVPVLWSVMLQWLKPPYLYLVINCIIISIVASSKLQQNDGASSSAPEKVVLSGDVRTGFDHRVVYDDASDLASEKAVLSGDVRTGGYGVVYEDVRDLGGQVEEEKKNVGDSETAAYAGGEVGMEAAASALQRSDSMEFLERLFEKEKAREREKPPFSSRFGQRKAVKANPEGGKALKVSKPKRHDTLESTWKTITEGRAMPLNRHLKKSDTWDTHVRQNTTSPLPPPKMKKSETFNDHTTTNANNGSNNSGRFRKEPSLSQDELNRRVEAFINKFNEEMRLQRQRSLDQYNQMISSGANYGV